MPTSAPASALLAHSIELLSALGCVRSRRMFGGHGLYVDERFVALIAFDRLFLKADATTAPRFAEAGCEPFVYEGAGRSVTVNYWTAPAEALDSPQAMLPWARLALQAALTAAAKKPAAKRKAPAGRPKAALKPAARRR